MLKEQQVRAFLEIPREHEGHVVEVRPCPVAKGQVHFHHALTWHGSQANMSGRPRRAIAIHLMTNRTCFDAGGRHPMKQFMEVGEGRKVEGEHFPLVWSAARSAAAV